ncbi:type II secretion system GspH family protein, partial [Patescibacteria group bacterium]|nr:type II secretion system GspH family protein [Patescibacteria group bacterium]
MKNMKFFNKGFTLIEVVAVIGVLAITSGILLVNTRTTEVQLNLSQDTANVASAINRAKALTIQNLEDGICGYGVHFAPGDSNAPDKYIVFKDKDDCNNVSYSKNDEILSGEGGENELNSELEFESNEHDMVIRDIIFYSSDARVKLISTETNKSNIDPTGIIIIKTKTTPVSYMTLKINVTGQVSKMDSKTEAGEGGEYNIDNIVDDIFNGDGDGGSGIGDDNGSGIIDDDCIPNCSCVIGLASGETCSDGCRGICYAGQDPWNPFGCALPLTNPHSICVNDVCISNNICGFTDCSGCGGSCVIPGQTN